MKFSRADRIHEFNTVFPPSAAGIHQPGELGEEVVLVHPFFPASWFTDGMAIEEVTGGVGASSADHSVVPTGRYRWYHAASLLKIAASTSTHFFGISIVAQAGAVASIVYHSRPTSGETPTPAATITTGAFCPRSILVPQGMFLRGFADSNIPDATLELRLSVLFRELNIGEPFHAV